MPTTETPAANDLLSTLESAHEALKAIHIHYDRAEQLKKDAESATAAALSQRKKYIALAIVIGLAFFPFGLIGSALALFLYYKKKSAADALSEQCHANAIKEGAVAEQITVDNVAVLSILPREYWYPLATENIIKLLRDGRATSLNDALDRFDSLRREWIQDQHYAEVSAAMAQQSSNLESIERSSRINTAINAGRTAADITRGVARGVGKFFDSIG